MRSTCGVSHKQEGMDLFSPHFVRDTAWAAPSRHSARYPLSPLASSPSLTVPVLGLKKIPDPLTHTSPMHFILIYQPLRVSFPCLCHGSTVHQSTHSWACILKSLCLLVLSAYPQGKAPSLGSYYFLPSSLLPLGCFGETMQPGDGCILSVVSESLTTRLSNNLAKCPQPPPSFTWLDIPNP